MSTEGLLDLTDDDFDEAISRARGPMLVDFWASWCAPCKQIAPALEEISLEFAGRATVARLDVDENGDVMNRFGIRSIPTLVVFRDGRVVDRMIGAAPKDEIRRLLERHLAGAV